MLLIVGLDPGTTVGVALLNLEGEVVKVFSLKNPNKSEVISEIEKHGTPVMVACDVSQIPEFVQKVASAFNVKVWHPEEDLKREEKLRLVRGHEFRNYHERDALACAIKALNSYQNKIRQALRIIKEEGAEEKTEEVLRGIFLGEAIRESLKEKKEEERKREKKKEKDREKVLLLRRVSELKRMLKDVEREKERLERKVRDLEEKLEIEKSKRKSFLEKEKEIRKIKALMDKLKYDVFIARREREEAREKLEKLLDHIKSLVEGKEVVRIGMKVFELKPVQSKKIEVVGEEKFGEICFLKVKKGKELNLRKIIEEIRGGKLA